MMGDYRESILMVAKIQIYKLHLFILSEGTRKVLVQPGQDLGPAFSLIRSICITGTTQTIRSTLGWREISLVSQLRKVREYVWRDQLYGMADRWKLINCSCEIAACSVRLDHVAHNEVVDLARKVNRVCQFRPKPHICPQMSR